MMRSRDRSSSQMLTPAAERCCGGGGSWCVSFVRARQLPTAAMVSRAAATTASVVMPNFAEQGLVVGGGAEVLDRDAAAAVADDAAPGERDAGLDRHAGGDGGGQHGLAVRGILLVEPLEATAPRRRGR